MHDYRKLRVEFEAKGFTEVDAFKIVDWIETEDIISEKLHAIECRDKARLTDGIYKYYSHLFNIEKRHELALLDLIGFLREQIDIERFQRNRLLDTSQREKSIFLATVLKYFCKFEDWQIVLIIGLRESQNRASGDVLNMSFV